MDVNLISTLNLVDDKSILNYELVKRNTLQDHDNVDHAAETIWEINDDKNNALDTNDAQNRLIIPLLRDNLVVGDLLLVFQEDKQLSQQEIELLKLYTTLLTNVENRFKSFSELSEAKKEIELINSSLESKVLENTKRNLNLSKTIVEQEKMATIGEISAGIAHDLNTPLGSIKTGAESISYSIESIFKMAYLLTEEESKLAIKLSNERKVDVFLGGLQMMRETKSMMEFIKNTYKIEDDNTKKLADLLIKCRIHKEEEELISQLIQLPNSLTFLEILFGMLTTNSLLSSVSDSVSRATDVVQNIRSFIKKDVSSGLVRNEINLKDNIRVVLNIFNFEFKKSMNLEVDLPDNLIVKGFDVKLFQLWSNLIKNAIDAMENTTSKRLIIKGFEEENKAVISISNSGEMIPLEIQDHIFKKFFSTKKDKNGTGLGLSIVQSVIDEHNAQISLTSSEEITTFSVRFNKN
jgi:signal transduction histidine kinase